jgi:ADP-heptose:LPS heptosyltransferase
MYVYFDGSQGTEVPTKYINNRKVVFYPYLPVEIPIDVAQSLIKRPFFKTIRNLNEHIQKYDLTGRYKILIIRDEGIGDILMTTPAVRALKEKLKVTIHYATNPNYKILLEHNPHVDKIFPIKSFSEELPDLKKEDYHQIIDLRRHSEHSPTRNKRNRIYTYTEKTGVEIDIDKINTILNVSDDTIELGKRIISYDKKYKYIGMQMTATHYCRNWDLEKFKVLAKKLCDEGFKVVLIDKLAVDWEWDNLINLTGKTNVEEMVGIISQMDLMVSVDTGGYHIAGSLGIPFIVLMGIISPKFRTSHYSCWHKDLTAKMDCIGCGNSHMDKCKVSGSVDLAVCMDKLPVDIVYNSAKEYFNNHYKKIEVKANPKEIIKQDIKITEGIKKFTLAMIVLNEAEYLPRLIDNLFKHPAIKRVVAIDGGSNDKTVEILKNAGAEVYIHPWNFDYHDQVALQRNISFSYIPEDERVICIDPDEICSKELLGALIELANRPEGFICLPRRTFKSYAGAVKYFETGNNSDQYLQYPDWQPRIYANKRELKFFRSPHHLTLNIGKPINLPGLDILHYERSKKEDNIKRDNQWSALIEKGKNLGLGSWYK